MGNVSSSATTTTQPSDFALNIVLLAKAGRCEELKDLILKIQTFIKTSKGSSFPYRREDYFRDVNQNEEAFLEAGINGHIECLKVLRDAGIQDVKKKVIREIMLDAVVNNDREVIKFLADFPYMALGVGTDTDETSAKKLRRDIIREAVRENDTELIDFLFKLGFLSVSITKKRGLIEDVNLFVPDLFDYMTPIFNPEEHKKDINKKENTPHIPTQTEPTTFLISPPLSVDYNVRTSKCFDLIMLDEEDAANYLAQDEDNIIILNKPEGVAICFTKTALRSAVEDRSARFIECLGPIIDEVGDKGQRWIGENPPLYIKVPVNPETGTNAFIPIENLREALGTNERVYCLVPLSLKDERGVQASLSHTITEAVRRGESDYVSANHCQRGSNVLLYKFVKCRFVAPPSTVATRRSRSPSPSLQTKKRRRQF